MTLAMDRVNLDDKISRNAGAFIILDPNKSLSYFALDILQIFGIEAFPFNLENIVKVAKRNQHKAMVLSELLSPLTPSRYGGSSFYGGSTWYKICVFL